MIELIETLPSHVSAGDSNVITAIWSRNGSLILLPETYHTKLVLPTTNLALNGNIVCIAYVT